MPLPGARRMAVRATGRAGSDSLEGAGRLCIIPTFPAAEPETSAGQLFSGLPVYLRVGRGAAVILSNLLLESRMRNFVYASLLALFSVAAAVSEEPTLATVEGGEDLEKVKGKFSETYVNPAVDFSQYDKLYLGDAYFDYRDVGPAESHRSTMQSYPSKAVFGIAEAEREKFETIVDEAFTKELGKSKHFTIVDELGDNTMIIRGAAVDIVSKVPPEFIGRSEIYLASVGEATLILEFLDGKSGEVLARVAERRTIGKGRIDMATIPTNSVTVWSDVRRWASSSAKRLRSELDAAVKG